MVSLYLTKREKYSESGLFIHHILGKYYNLTTTIGRTNNGKPYAIDLVDIHFSISHSGDLLVAAVSTSPVGVDVERVKDIDTDISLAWFSTTERASLEQPTENEKLKRFYEIWTCKESYSKMKGLGLLMDYRSFDILNMPHYSFKTFYSQEYILSACSHGDQICDRLIFEDGLNGASFEN